MSDHQEPNPYQTQAGSPHYSQQQYSMPKKTNTVAIIGFVFAILGLLLSRIPIINFLAILLALIGFTLGIIGIVLAQKPDTGGKGLATAAVVVSVVAGAVVIASSMSFFKTINDYAQSVRGIQSSVNGVVQGALDEAQSQLKKLSAGTTADLLGKEVTVDIGKFSVESTTQASLSVKVTNISSQKQSYIILIEAVNDQGKSFYNDSLIVNELKPGQSQDLKAFQSAPSDKIEALKTATFRVASIMQAHT